MCHINEKNEIEDCGSCAHAKADGTMLICSLTGKQMNDNEYCESFKD